tara:strand:+ start:661 stop:1776 length:1116 start_codon:yes stop_codon:yes gene_type:complete
MTKAAELAKMGEVLTNSQIGGRRNIVINGAMNVAQRSTSVSGIGASADYFTVDRFATLPNDTAGRLTQSQVAVTDLPGFANALKLECTTADTSTATGEYLLLEQGFEGQDLQQMKKGTSDAEKVTVSFYVKGNASATYAVELLDADNTRFVSQSFSVTTSWNRVILTFPADTTGAFDDDNAKSLRLFFWLHSGATYASGTLSTTWHATAANRAAGISSFFDSTDRTFFLTGVQMEIGSQATPFEHRTFGEELELCKRYFQKTGNVSGNAYTPLTPYFDAATTSVGYCPIPLRPKMRLASAIAVSHSGVGELGLSIGTGTSAVSAVALQAAQSGEDFITIKFTSSDTLTQYRPMRVYANNDATAFIAFDAEL